MKEGKKSKIAYKNPEKSDYSLSFGASMRNWICHSAREYKLAWVVTSLIIHGNVIQTIPAKSLETLLVFSIKSYIFLPPLPRNNVESHLLCVEDTSGIKHDTQIMTTLFRGRGWYLHNFEVECHCFFQNAYFDVSVSSTFGRDCLRFAYIHGYENLLRKYFNFVENVI